MLAYAADTPRPAVRAGSPKALTLILLGHAALISAVMMARMDVVGPIIDDIPKLIQVGPIDPPPPPPPPDPKPQVQANPAHRPIQDPVIDHSPPIVPMGQTAPSGLDNGPLVPPLPPLGGGGVTVPDPPAHNPVKLGPRFATAADAVRPDYPLDKIRMQEEATLKLRLTIDARGRVTAVEPVGAADPSFLTAARRHILRSWRYKPATEDGVAVPSSTVISLSFRLEDA
jgi:protein TonB